MDKPSIKINALSVSYGKKRVLTNIYLDIEPGHIYGLIGPNGAGKSTLFKAILGLLDPSSGFIELLGGDISDCRDRVAYVPQRDEVDWDFPANVEDIVLMGRYPHKKVFQRLSRYDREIARHSMQQLDILDLRKRQIGQLSGGQQQRVFLARALCQQADIILLDEPFVGVDLRTEEKIISILKDQAREGKTMLVVHHDLTSVQNYFTRVILLNQRLIACGDTEDTFHEKNITKTYGAQLNILHKTGLMG